VKIKSAKSFRFWYKTKVKEIERNNLSHNENFVGTYHVENGKKIKGFFEMYHGDKPDIVSYLPSILKIAEDGQAIYEFLQNAVDCNSTHFYIFYNENYFLAINNGEPFDIKGLQSVLNIAQTTKKSCDKIGRFGIGFKLIHRLVGKNEGVSELVNQYKGPILYSWAKLQDLQGLMMNEPLEPLLPNKENYSDFLNAPYLLKLILTNFPAEPNETVKDLKYKDRVVFSQEELNELIDFLNDSFQQHAENIKMNDLKQGSIFFLRLGEGKKEMLDRDYDNLKKGVEYSMNTLKRLQKVYINSEEISKKTLDLEEFEIDKNSGDFKKINPEYKECNVKITFGYYQNYKESEKIKASPNFYKYFPMGDETNGFSFIIHCDSFSNEANRRKLQRDEINKNLFPVISDFIIKRLNEYKLNNRIQFLRLYTCLLLSDVPEKQNNEWLKPIFYDTLLEYLRANIPTKTNKYSEVSKKVKINKLKIKINLSDFGLEHIEWFEWESENDNYLTSQAIETKKLGLEAWDIRDIIENAHLNSLNVWIKNQNLAQYNSFLNEIEKSDLRKATKSRLFEIKLFRFSDHNFYSPNDLSSNDDLIFNIAKTIKIKPELENLGFITSQIDISKLENIFTTLASKLPTDKNLYESIAVKCEDNNLTSKEKQKLFLNFVQDETKFDNINEGTLRNLALFCTNKDVIKPICELVDSKLNTPVWINPFKITAEENFAGLEKYLISEKELYQKIILPHWESIIYDAPNVVELYQKTKEYYDLNDKNTPFKNQNFVFINENETYISASDVFYNSRFVQVTKYTDFQHAVYRLTNAKTPFKKILSFLKDAPFKVENSNLLEFGISNTEISIDEVKIVLSFCKSNNENFFQKYTIENQGKNYSISIKSSSIYQVRPSNKQVKKFIEENLSTELKILPYEIDEYKEELGIIQGEHLYDLIIESVDIDHFKLELIDIISYDEPKRKFLLQLLEIVFVVGEAYHKESFEYKVLDLACSYLKEADYQQFRTKIIISTKEQKLKLSEIPPYTDKIIIEGCELSLAKILPKSYYNSDYLSDLVNNFSSSGLLKEKLNLVLGISQETELETIFTLLSESETLLENEQQLAFLILFNDLYPIDFKKFEVETLDGKHHLDYTYYTNSYIFISKNAVLADRYGGISKLLSLPTKDNVNSNTQIISKPYFNDNNFVCPYLKESLTDNEKIELLEFLFEIHSTNKSIFSNQRSWIKIDDHETQKLLGFNPLYSVYPSNFALEEENLPIYLQTWVGNNSDKNNFLSDLGVFAPNTVLIDLRKYFNNTGTFTKSKIAQESRFNEGKMLFNTLKWLKTYKVIIDSTEKLEVFEEIVRVINSNRAKNDELTIQTEYDFELLENNSKEWNEPYYISWKLELKNKFSISLYDGTLPNVIKLNEIENYVFYRFNKGDIIIDKNNHIYINQKVDLAKALRSITDDNFTFKHLYDLFESTENVKREVGISEQDKQLLEKIKKFGSDKIIDIITKLEGRNLDDVIKVGMQAFSNEGAKINAGNEGERIVFEDLITTFGREKVRWTSAENPNLVGIATNEYDFIVYKSSANNEILYYIDAKSTTTEKYGTDKTEIYWRNSEWRFIENEVADNYLIARVFNVNSSNPEIIYLKVNKQDIYELNFRLEEKKQHTTKYL